MTATLARGPYRVLRGNRPLALLVGGEGLSSLADWFLAVLLAGMAYRLTHSGGTVTLLTVVRLAPYAVVLPWSGIVLDRVDRRHLMSGLGLGRALFVLGLLAVQSRGTLPLAFLLVFLSSSLSCLLRPTVNATLPDLVERRETIAANSLVSQVDGIGRIVGSALGALFTTSHLHPFGVLAVSCAFMLSGTSFFLAPLRARSASLSVDLSPSQALAGFRYIWNENERVLVALAVAGAGLGLLAGAYYPLITLLSNRVFHMGNPGIGWLDTMYGAGGLASSLLMGWLMRGRRVVHLFIAGTALNALGVFLLGLSPIGPAPFACIALIGMADVVIQVTGTTILQAGAPHDMLARVFTASEATLVLATLCGAALSGPLLKSIEPRVATLLYGVAAAALLLIAFPRLRSVEDVLGLRVFLRGVPLLAGLPRSLLDELAPRFEAVAFPAGATIVREGEPGDCLFIIRSGEVEVSVGGRVVRTLGPARYFGEVALLHTGPRTATVKAVEDTCLFSLDRAAFQDLLLRADGLQTELVARATTYYVYAPLARLWE